MAKHLTKQDINSIISIITGWKQEKMTWNDICKAAGDLVGKIPTRQSLNTNHEIKNAYEVKKLGLKTHGPRTSVPSSLKLAADRISRQQSEIDLLKSKNSALLEQFVKWQYNAYKHGLKEPQLNESLPVIDRHRTE